MDCNGKGREVYFRDALAKKKRDTRNTERRVRVLAERIKEVGQEKIENYNIFIETGEDRERIYTF